MVSYSATKKSPERVFVYEVQSHSCEWLTRGGENREYLLLA